MPQAIINYWAVLVAALANMVLGSIWYSKPLFGTAWMKLTGAKMDGAKQNMAKTMSGAIIAALVMSYILAHFVDYVGAVTIWDGIQLGFWVWLGFMATISINDILFGQKSWKLYFINNGFFLINAIVMSVILALWQ